MTAYARGFARGAKFARNTIETNDRRFKSLFEDLPPGVDGRVDWLNGFAAGIKHVAYPMAVERNVGKSLQEAFDSA